MSRIRYKKENVLAIGCTHEPFTKEGFIDFCLDVKKEKRCGTVVHCGDLFDSYNISLRDLDPNGKSPKDEIIATRKKLKEWYKAFPIVKYTPGNHCLRVYRKAKKAGIPDICMRPIREIWQIPDRWEINHEFVIDNVIYNHGFSATKRAAIISAIYHRMSTVQAHGHTTACTDFSASARDRIFGMSIGTGIDRSAMAFAYGHGFKEKPIVSCGTVEHGENPHVHMMDL
jgi:hypothetical protein